MKLKEIKRVTLLKLAPPITYFLIKLLYFSCKKEFIMPKESPKEPLIIAFWHRKLLFQPFLYNKFRTNHQVRAMISEHFDGELIAKLISFFNFETVRGSSNKRAIKVFLNAISSLKDGYDVAITPDGPRGPIYSIADGVIALAQKTNSKVIIFDYIPSTYWELKSWDKFIIPKPFSKIKFIAQEPFSLNDMEFKEAKEFIKSRLKNNES